MYLFTRAGRFGPGSIRESMSFVEAITEKVHQESGLATHAWASMLSPDLGTTVWATFVDDLEHLQEATDKLAVSDSFASLAEQGARLFVGPLSDGLAVVVHGEPDPTAPLPSYVVTARATATNGSLSSAMANGVEIAEAAERITGQRTMFLADSTGHYGGCRWSTGFSDLAALERAEAALTIDPDWLALIDRCGPSYAAGVTQSMYRRIV